MDSNIDIPLVRILRIDAAEHAINLRMPFKFGASIVKQVNQLFVSVLVEMPGGETVTGISSELMVPKWFDKSPSLDNETNIAHLRRSVELASTAYCKDGKAGTVFDHHVKHVDDHERRCAEEGLRPLVASYGIALIDRAIIDGLGKAFDLPAHMLVRQNLLGIDNRTTPDLANTQIDETLTSLDPQPYIHVRHTIGMLDALSKEEIAAEERLSDGLPQSLDQVIERYGHRYFKIKIGNDNEANIIRLRKISAVFEEMVPDYFASLDANEQYPDQQGPIDLIKRLRETADMEKFVNRILYLEQPIDRDVALTRDIKELAALVPLEIDESDAQMESFRTAQSLGYTGVSSKSCKGFYRSLLNRVRCDVMNNKTDDEPFFMTAEDLTTPGGLPVQQDLALASLIGCTHIERNGHHYIQGMHAVTDIERAAFVDHHGDLYHNSNGVSLLSIKDGKLSLASVHNAPGLGYEGTVGDALNWRQLS